MDEGSPEPENLPRPDYRYSLANERTYLSWTRTALALIAGSVALEQFATLSVSWIVQAVGVIGILLGAIMSGWALRYFRGVQHAIEKDRPLPRQPAVPVLTVGIIVISALLIAGIALS